MFPKPSHGRQWRERIMWPVIRKYLVFIVLRSAEIANWMLLGIGCRSMMGSNGSLVMPIEKGSIDGREKPSREVSADSKSRQRNAAPFRTETFLLVGAGWSRCNRNSQSAGSECARFGIPPLLARFEEKIFRTEPEDRCTKRNRRRKKNPGSGRSAPDQGTKTRAQEVEPEQ